MLTMVVNPCSRQKGILYFAIHDIEPGADRRSKFDLTNSMNTSVNSAHARCFYTADQNKTFQDQRVFYNMVVMNTSTNAAST